MTALQTAWKRMLFPSWGASGVILAAAKLDGDDERNEEDEV